MRLAWGIDEVVSDYISKAFPDLTRCMPYKAHVAVGFVNNDDLLVGGLALRFLNAFDASLSIYLEDPRCLTPRILRELFHKAFNEAGLVRLTCTVMRRNKRMRRLAEGLGFKLEGMKAKGFDGRRDAAIYGMTADQCKWIKGAS